MNRILLVEDHPRLGELIAASLRQAGIAVDVLTSMREADYALAHARYDAAVVDRGLPDGDGLALVRTVRQRGEHMPCLLLTARDALHDRVDGLEAGADDYLTKPFAMEELVARVRALMRRSAAPLRQVEPEFAGLRADLRKGNMVFGEQSVPLPRTEMQMLTSLLRAAGGLVSRNELERAAWGLNEAVTPNALDVALHRLRRKLTAVGCPLQLVNVRGHGFALKPEPGDAP